MKIQLKKLLAFGMLGLIIALSSCDGGEEEEDIDPRDKFVGSWNVEETVGEDVTHYSVNIEYATNSAYITIYNIYFLGSDNFVDALVTGNNLTISEQETCDHKIAGSGKYVSGDKFTLSYTAKTTTDEYHIESVFSK